MVDNVTVDVNGHALTVKDGTFEAKKGFTLETLTVLDKDGKEIELTDLGDGKYGFRMPGGAVTVSATFMEDNTMLNFFVDVKAKSYCYDAVLWAAQNGITKGAPRRPLRRRRPARAAKP